MKNVLAKLANQMSRTLRGSTCFRLLLINSMYSKDRKGGGRRKGGLGIQTGGKRWWRKEGGANIQEVGGGITSMVGYLVCVSEMFCVFCLFVTNKYIENGIGESLVPHNEYSCQYRRHTGDKIKTSVVG